MKKYKAIFFDWDGTAVTSRKGPVDDIITAMQSLLEKGVKLAIISGTTMENIADGRIEEKLTEKQLENLYLGLARGAFNYSFVHGKCTLFSNLVPSIEIMSNIHLICFEIHKELLEKYKFETDIVFSRPNYCKIDLLVSSQRNEQLFMQENELDRLKRNLNEHGIHGGMKCLMDLAVEIGAKHGVVVKPTCDAKYLEVGITSKSDNVTEILHRMNLEGHIAAKDCSFWGDEFVEIEPGIFGSDSFMRTQETYEGDFYDVSGVSGARPEGVIRLGGGVERFLEFLRNQV